MNKQNHKTNGICGNCHNSIDNAEYCSQCGQKNTDGRISIGEFFSVVFSTVFNLESKFFQTIRDIFIPGKLTTEWFKGRHKPYFHPVRLFIVTALLLIAALSPFISDTETIIGDVDSYEQAQKESFRKEFLNEVDNYNVLYLKDKKDKSVIDSLTKTLREGNISFDKNIISNVDKKSNIPDLKNKPPKEIISYFENEFGAIYTDSVLNVVKSKRRLTRDSVQLPNLIGDDKKHKISNEDFLELSPTEIADKYQVKGFVNRIGFKQRIRLQQSGKNLMPFVLGNSLWVALLMMPFLAIILKLLYYRHDYYYVEHLIFSFHSHSFAFILFTCICIFINVVYQHPMIIMSGFLLLFIYLFKSLRYVYNQGRWKTLSKLLIANFIYLCLFFIFGLLGFIVSIFLF